MKKKFDWEYWKVVLCAIFIVIAFLGSIIFFALMDGLVYSILSLALTLLFVIMCMIYDDI